MFNEVSELSQTITKINNERKQMKKQKLELKYDIKDMGPFIVIVESKSGNNIGNIHPMNLGKKLAALNIKGIINISKKGKKRISIEFDIPDRANNFLKEHPFLQDQDIDVFIPSRMVCSRGVVKNVGSEITKDDFLDFAESKIAILDARQLNRRVVREGVVSYEPSNTWVLTFKGRNIPDRIGL